MSYKKSSDFFWPYIYLDKDVLTIRSTITRNWFSCSSCNHMKHFCRDGVFTVTSFEVRQPVTFSAGFYVSFKLTPIYYVLLKEFASNVGHRFNLIYLVLDQLCTMGILPCHLVVCRVWQCKPLQLWPMALQPSCCSWCKLFSLVLKSVHFVVIIKRFALKIKSTQSIPNWWVLEIGKHF